MADARDRAAARQPRSRPDPRAGCASAGTGSASTTTVALRRLSRPGPGPRRAGPRPGDRALSRVCGWRPGVRHSRPLRRPPPAPRVGDRPAAPASSARRGAAGYERDQRRRPARRRTADRVSAGSASAAIARVRARLLFSLPPLHPAPALAPLIARTARLARCAAHAIPALAGVLRGPGDRRRLRPSSAMCTASGPSRATTRRRMGVAARRSSTPAAGSTRHCWPAGASPRTRTGRVARC